MAYLNDNQEIHAGDTRTLVLRVASADAAKLDLVPGPLDGVHVEWWLAENSQPTAPQIHVRKTRDEGVTLTRDSAGAWTINVPLLEENTAALVAPKDYYHEARVTDAAGEVLVTTVGVVTVRRSMIAYGLFSGEIEPPLAAGSPTLDAATRAENAADLAAANALEALTERFLGEWNNGEAYSALDIVAYQGSSYIATEATTAGQTPGIHASWALIALKGDDGEPGPAGDDGAPGPQGDIGPQGDPGPAGTDAEITYVSFDALTALPGVELASADLFLVGDASATAPKKLTFSGLAAGLATAFTALVLTGGAVVASTPLFSATQTWNNGAVTFKAIDINVTNTASAAGSVLMDLQLGGVSQFSVNKAGIMTGAPDGFFRGIAISDASSNIIRIGNSGGIYSAILHNGTGQIGLSFQGAIVNVLNFASNIAVSPDLFLRRAAAANIRLGAADAAAPVAQTLSVQSVVAGTSNTAGANFNIDGSQGTGTGAGGAIVFRVAPAGSSGSAVNALATAMTIAGTGAATFSGSVTATSVGVGGQYFGANTFAGSGLACFQVSGAFGLGREPTLTGNILLGRVNGFAALSTFEFGDGAFSASPQGVTLTAPSGTGTNIAGGSLTLLGGVSTGSVAGGSIRFQVTPAGSSGSARNAAVTALTINSSPTNGQVVVAGVGSGFDAFRVNAAFGGNWNNQYTSVNAYGGLQSVALTTEAANISYGVIGVGDTWARIGFGLDTGTPFFGFGPGSATRDTFLRRRSAANMQLGMGDAAAPVAQTLSVQNVLAGTSNTAGAERYYDGSQGTGTGAGGSHIFRVAPAGSSGSAQNALVNALTIASDGRVTAATTLSAEAVRGSSFQMQSGAVVTDATTERTLTAGDNGKVLYFTSGSAITLTTAAGLGAGFSCTIVQGGAGQITVAQGASTTLVLRASRNKTAAQYAMAAMFSPVADTFIFTGDTTV